MPRSLPQLPYENIVPGAVAATIFAFACGSSSVASVNHAGKSLRWAMLVVLLVVAAAWAFTRLRDVLPFPVAFAAGFFLALAVVSSLWSVDSRLSFERAGSVVLIFAAAALLSVGGAPERVLAGVVSGAAAVAVAGLVVLAVSHADAVVSADTEVPWRYRGFAENANTAPLLFGLALPLALAALVRARRRAARALAGAAFLLLLGSIVASGSRGGLAAGAVGALVVVVGIRLSRRGRAGLAVAAVAVGGLALYLQTLPEPLPIVPPKHPAHAAPASPRPLPRYVDVDPYYPLDADVGGPLPGGGQPTIRRTLFAASGRGEAWLGAIRQAAQRPLLGYGFGTEARVFVDRYYYFVGDLPENAYIGIALQLGLVGLVALFAVPAVAAASSWAALRGRNTVAVAAAAAVAAGLAAGVTQSFPYSAGDIAAGTFWISVFALAAAPRGAE